MSNILTFTPFCGFLSFLKPVRLAEAFISVPMLKKITAFSVSATNAPQVHLVDAVTYWRNNVLMFVRLRRPYRAGERCFAFFCFQIPKPVRCIMSATFFLSRPGRCAGRGPLSRLIQKLARLGENAAIIALCDLPVSLGSRVRWTLYGTSLTVEVAS